MGRGHPLTRNNTGSGQKRVDHESENAEYIVWVGQSSTKLKIG